MGKSWFVSGMRRGVLPSLSFIANKKRSLLRPSVAEESHGYYGGHGMECEPKWEET